VAIVRSLFTARAEQDVRISRSRGGNGHGGQHEHGRKAGGNGCKTVSRAGETCTRSARCLAPEGSPPTPGMIAFPPAALAVVHRDTVVGHRIGFAGHLSS
jgi:hypothetical protein